MCENCKNYKPKEPNESLEDFNKNVVKPPFKVVDDTVWVDTKDGWKPKEPNESLEEKLYDAYFSEDTTDYTIMEECELYAQIARSHYQEHPNEMFTVPFLRTYTKKGMVSIEDVLRVFDEKTIGKSFNINFGASSNRIMSAVQEMIINLRKAIEKLGEKK